MTKLSRIALTFGLVLAITTPGQAGDGFLRPFFRLADRGSRTVAHRVPSYAPSPYQYSSAGAYAYQQDDAPPAVEAAAYYAQPAAAPAAAQPATYGGDPYGFLGLLNQYRASVGLQPVAFDPNLTAWASQNNAVQTRRGIGHHVNPNCFQNCGWNQSSASDVFRGWLRSPGHRQNMLSPSITRAGIAYGPGPYWTLNAR